MELTEEELNRFISKIDFRLPNECWLWCGATTQNYYGQFTIYGNGKRNIRTNRLMYALSRNLLEIPRNFYVLHTCDNSLCVNPLHLYLGTPKDNVKDMFKRGRQSCRKGISNGRSKLTEVKVKRIREFLACPIKQKDIATTFGVSISTIERIKAGIAWSHIK